MIKSRDDIFLVAMLLYRVLGVKEECRSVLINCVTIAAAQATSRGVRNSLGWDGRTSFMRVAW